MKTYDRGWPEVLTEKQLVRYLQISRETLSRMRKNGEMVGKKVGYQWRTPLDDVRAIFGLGPRG
jgi:excisionase family DNA binding protein